MESPEVPLTLTAAQAEAIIHKHLAEHRQSTVTHITELKNRGYSYTSRTRTYIVDIAAAPPQSPPLPAAAAAASGTSSCFITIAHPPRTPAPAPRILANDLHTTHHIIALIRAQTDIPIPLPVLDTSLSTTTTTITDSNPNDSNGTVPYHYLLSPPSPIPSRAILSIAEAKRRGLLLPPTTSDDGSSSSKQSVLLDLQIGRFLGRMHANVQNDYFGRIRVPPPSSGGGGGGGSGGGSGGVGGSGATTTQDPASTEPVSYSWQETFTSHLEALLWEAESAGLALPYEEIRTYLSRAISFFLFDDVEVPSLVWLSGSEEDVYVALPALGAQPPTTTTITTPTSSPEGGGIAAILPNLTHALWADPLLETFFLSSPSPSPSAALSEAYLQSGGAQLIVFPRQRTKRMWYDLLLALVVLRERDGFGAAAAAAAAVGGGGAGGGEGGGGGGEGEGGDAEGGLSGGGVVPLPEEIVHLQARDEEDEKDRKRLVAWALALIRKTIASLATAPTY